MKTTILIPILWLVLFTFIDIVQTIWLPHAFNWQKLRAWRLFGKTPQMPASLQYGDSNYYRQQGGSYPYYTWPYQCGKLQAYSKPIVYSPQSSALYYGYPALQQLQHQPLGTVVSKPVAVKAVGSSLLYYAPNEPHQHEPVQWPIQRLPNIESTNLRNSLKHFQSVDSQSSKVQSELQWLQQQQPQQKKKQRPLVIAHNGIFILNGGGAAATELLIHAKGGKVLGTSTEPNQQLS